MTTKELAEKLKQVRRYEKLQRLLASLQKTVIALNKHCGSLRFILDAMPDKFDDSFMIAIENEINRTNLNIDCWRN